MADFLIVEDECLIGTALAAVVRRETGGTAVLACSIAAAESHLASRLFDLALLDINLRDETSFELARRLRRMGLPFVFLSGANHVDIPQDLQSACFIPKPCRAHELISCIRAVLDAHSRARQNGR